VGSENANFCLFLVLKTCLHNMYMNGPKKTSWLCEHKLNIEDMRKSSIVYLLKMEYGLFIWLEVSFMICTYTTQIILKFLHTCGNLFLDQFSYILHKRRIFAQNANSLTKITIFLHGGISIKKLWCTHDK
jgi:hypothetical protein